MHLNELVLSLNLVCLACHGLVQFFYFVHYNTVLQVTVFVSIFSFPPNSLVASWTGFPFIRRKMTQFLSSRSFQSRLLYLICAIVEIQIRCYGVQKKQQFKKKTTVLLISYTRLYICTKIIYVLFYLILNSHTELMLFFFTLISKSRNWDAKRLNNPLKVTQLGDSRSRALLNICRVLF